MSTCAPPNVDSSVCYGWQSPSATSVDKCTWHRVDDGRAVAVTHVSHYETLPAADDHLHDNLISVGRIELCPDSTGAHQQCHTLMCLFNGSSGYTCERMLSEYGWYSPTMENSLGTCTYRTDSGKTVHVTTVTDAPDHCTGYSDMQYVGRVGSFLRKFPPSTARRVLPIDYANV